MERGNDWTVRTAREVGKRVAYFRARVTDDRGRPLSIQALSDRCTKLGLALGRPALSKLENGMRQSVTVDEVIVLGKALGVPPVLLLFPLGREETVEVLPGEHAGTLDALTWFTGSDDPDIELFRTHKTLVEAWPPGQEGPVPTALMTGAMTDGEERRWRQAVLIQQQLRQARAFIREHGLTPPGLPPDLAWIDDQETARGAR